MSYFCIFPNSTEFPVPLYPVLGLILCAGLYTALFQFTLQKVIEKLFALSSGYGHVERTIIYLFIINFPIIVLSVSCLIYNHSLIGYFISTDIDIFQILIVASYICHVQQSRQTPISGFLFIRDLLITAGFLGALLFLFYDGKMQASYGFILGGFYFFYYISQLFQQQIEEGTLKFLKLKDIDNYNSTYLLTKTWRQADFLEIKQIIKQKQERVMNVSNEFQIILDNVVPNIDERQILLNFSKLFLPYVAAITIKQQKRIEQYEEIYAAQFEESALEVRENYQENRENQIAEEEMKDRIDSFDRSDIDVFNRNTLTDDFVIEDEEISKDETEFEIALKYTFYPIYLISFVSGRLRYFLDYICFFLMLGSMWVISNSSYYFVKITDQFCYLFVSVVVSAMMVIPSSRYYLKISKYNDFDFVNMFLQSSILKSVIFSVAVTVLYFIDPAFECHGSLGLMLSVALCIVTYAAYGALMIGQKFATLKSNFKVVIGITVIIYSLRLVIQICFNKFINV